MSHNGIFITIEMLKMMLTMGWRLSNKGNCPMISLSDSLTLSESRAVKVDHDDDGNVDHYDIIIIISEN